MIGVDGTRKSEREMSDFVEKFKKVAILGQIL